MRLIYGMILLAGMGFVTIGITGCGSDTAPTVNEEHADDDHDHGDEDGEGEGLASDDHSGWWCNEHGVPEDECALCDTSLVADFKAKDDWCDDHNRPESQCFQCDATRFERFAARYEAKYGKQPPQPTE